MKIPFVGPAYTGRSSNLNNQRCVNFYIETDPSGKNVMALYGTPGLNLFVYLGILPMRGTYAVKDVLYGISGTTFYSILANGVATSIGTLLTSSGHVSMADNGTQIMIVDGPYGYIYNINTGVFARITDPDFPGADTVTFIDGYFIFNKPGTGAFMITSLYDGTAVDALDIATAESNPDLLISVATSHRELWLLGEYTTEIFYNSGNAAFPFDRINGASIEWGLAAKDSLTKCDNTLFWLAQTKSGKGFVVRANGYTPTIISTRALEYQIGTYSTIADAYAFSYIQEGHEFYVLTFPTGNATWVYDVSTQMWHERSSYGVGRWRAGSYAFCFGKHLVGDYLDGDIYELSMSAYTDRGDPIERIRTGQYLHSDMRPLFHHALIIDMETGVGTSTGQGSDPQAMLRWSNDGGHTWSNEHWAPMGKMGEYRRQVIWNRLGYSPNGRVYELKITDPVKVVIIDAQLEVTPGKR